MTLSSNVKTLLTFMLRIHNDSKTYFQMMYFTLEHGYLIHCTNNMQFFSLLTNTYTNLFLRYTN